MPQTQLPASFAGVLSMSAGQQMDLGTPTPSLDGRSSFTLSGWFQVPSTEDSVVVLSQSNLFTFFFSQRRAAVTMRSSMIQMTEALPAGQFHQLSVVYTVQQGSTNGILQFFVDGALVSQTALTGSASSTTQHLFVGNASFPVAVRRLWLTSTAVTPEELVDTRFGTTGTAPFAVQSTWDWGQVPAAIIGAPTPVALGGAAPSLTTPGLLPGSAGVASMALSTAETLTQVTLQGWFWFPSSVNQSQVGKQQTLALVTGASGGIDLHATPNSNGTWSLGTSVPRYGFGKDSVQLSGWHNIAATWVSGSDAILYLDGVLLVHSVQNMVFSVTASTLLAGNGSGSSSNQAFCGVVQNLVLWDVALPGGDVQACVMPWFPMTDIDPLAVFDFTQGPPIDVVSGETLSLQNGASVENVLWSASSVQPSTQMLVAKPRRQSLKGLRPQSTPKVDPSVWTKQKEDELLKELQGYLAQAKSDPRVQALGPDLEAKLKERFARGRAGNPDLTGIVRTEQQGDEWITFYYGPNGPEAILRRSTTEFKSDSCMNWVIDFVCTALFGLIDIMGIPLSTGAAVKAVQKLLGKAKIWKAIATVLEETITTTTITSILKAIYDGGGLTAFVKAVLDSVSWWDFLWMVAQVIIELVGLLVPGLEEAIVLAKCVLVVAQLIQVATECPPNCPA